MFVVWDKVEKYVFYQVNKLQLYRKKMHIRSVDLAARRKQISRRNTKSSDLHKLCSISKIEVVSQYSLYLHSGLFVFVAVI